MAEHAGLYSKPEKLFFLHFCVCVFLVLHRSESFAISSIRNVITSDFLMAKAKIWRPFQFAAYVLRQASSPKSTNFDIQAYYLRLAQIYSSVWALSFICRCSMKCRCGSTAVKWFGRNYVSGWGADQGWFLSVKLWIWEYLGFMKGVFRGKGHQTIILLSYECLVYRKAVG